MSQRPHQQRPRATRDAAHAQPATTGPTGTSLTALSAVLNAAPTVQRLTSLATNRTGLPDPLKAGVEAMSGVAMDHVRVHRNSTKPAQLNAHAYAQGSDIHLAPGQEKHLPHEAWHVVQQAQGRVKPTMQMKAGVPINDDTALEEEATTMGERAAAMPAQRMTEEEDQTLTKAPAGSAMEAAQRAVIVGGISYTHASRNMNSLFNDVVAPVFEKAGFKMYGLKSQLVAFVKEYRETEEEFASDKAFVDAFYQCVKDKTRKTRGAPTPVLKKFDVSSLSRPKWPTDYKTKLNVQIGDNIRHVVRNATLKRALVVEKQRLQHLSIDQQKRHFSQMAGALGAPITEESTIDVVIRAIYKKLYLNETNLFAGDGPTNQIIGFASDPIRALGAELLGMDGDVSVLDVDKRISEALFAAMEKVRADSGYKQLIVNDIQIIVQDALHSLIAANEGKEGEARLMVPAEVVGDLVDDMGLNFGFDLIDGRRDENSEGIGERQARLIKVEQALQIFNASKGQGQDLTAIFKAFLT
ncbi:DUF4157 domain-containing protein [Sphingomonas sp. RT2P30]|uniref:eCIS core domain-containing protein n=1 Tax=Parasphingomonas halimpatiens TaxID=3096162 RepID=UPI002FCC92E5